jgi:two-component system OmpR family sensor kinase
LEPADTNLSHLVLSIVHRYEAEETHQNCALEHDIEADVSGLFDPLAVEQIIDNLVSNALKFGAASP